MGHPWAVLTITLLLTLASGSQLPRIKADTDPKSMLPITSPVRQYTEQVEEWFGLHADVIVVGIWSEKGIFTPETLARIVRLTDGIMRLPGVITRDVVALPTVNDVTVAEDGVLQARPIVGRVPGDAAAADRLGQQLLGNALRVNRLISTEEADRGLDRMGLRPGTLHELLAFGAQHLDVQHEFPVVETGSRWLRPDGS